MWAVIYLGMPGGPGSWFARYYPFGRKGYSDTGPYSSRQEAIDWIKDIRRVS